MDAAAVLSNRSVDAVIEMVVQSVVTLLVIGVVHRCLPSAFKRWNSAPSPQTMILAGTALLGSGIVAVVLMNRVIAAAVGHAVPHNVVAPLLIALWHLTRRYDILRRFLAVATQLIVPKFVAPSLLAGIAVSTLVWMLRIGGGTNPPPAHTGAMSPTTMSRVVATTVPAVAPIGTEPHGSRRPLKVTEAPAPVMTTAVVARPTEDHTPAPQVRLPTRAADSTPTDPPTLPAAGTGPTLVATQYLPMPTTTLVVPPTLLPSPTTAAPTEEIPSISPTAEAQVPTAPAEQPSLTPVVCDVIRGRVPDEAVEKAVEHPEEISGWGELANPNVPYHPVQNTYRTSLTLQNRNVPFHPLNNSLVYKAGCP
jgi:hypothetical protein